MADAGRAAGAVGARGPRGTACPSDVSLDARDPLRLRERPRQIRRAATACDVEVRGDLRERHHHEGALVHARMRHREAGLAQRDLSVQQQIEIQRPGAVGNVPDAAVRTLDREEGLEQRARRKPGLDAGDRIDEVRLVCVTYRRRPVQGRARDQTRGGQGGQRAERGLHLSQR